MLFFERTLHQQCILKMSGVHYDVRIGRLDRRGDYGDGGGVVSVAVGIHDVDPMIVCRLDRTLLNFERKGIARRADRNGPRLRVALDRVLDDSDQVFARW